jgi:hypothetical protein
MLSQRSLSGSLIVFSLLLVALNFLLSTTMSADPSTQQQEQGIPAVDPASAAQDQYGKMAQGAGVGAGSGAAFGGALRRWPCDRLWDKAACLSCCLAVLLLQELLVPLEVLQAPSLGLLSVAWLAAWQVRGWLPCIPCFAVTQLHLASHLLLPPCYLLQVA